MRTLLRISMTAEGGNRAIRDGLMPKLIEQTTARIHPESSYFTADHGKRTGYFVFDMTDVSEMPAIAEPWFMNVNAEVEFQPVMNGEDLKKGLAKAPLK